MTRTRRALIRGCTSATLFALMQLATTAHAQSDSADDQFRRGVDAAGHQDFTGAAAAFEGALRLAPHPVTAFNAGLAWQSAGDGARAAEDYALSLSLGLAEPQAGLARERLAALVTTLACLELTGPAGAKAKVRDVERALPTTIYLPPGEASFEARLPDGRVVSRHVNVAAGSKAEVDFNEAVPAPAPPPAPAPLPAPESRGGAIRWPGWIAAGAGVVLVGVAVGVGVAGMSARDDFVAGGALDHDLRESAVTLRLASNVLWIGGAVLGAVGVTILLWPGRGAGDRTAGAFHVGPQGASLRLAF